MPVIFRYKGYRFFFIRMRVTRLSRRMFISETLRLKRNFGWFFGVQLARNDGFNARTLQELAGLVDTYQALFLEAWHEYFG